VSEDEIGERLCVVLAHPDDETIISGSLAMLSTKGCADRRNLELY
jgi:LmbE family N-acetylglucosaminyl deacetylase